ncbi:hypothetical protein MKX01_031268 [Papaver californicum]|nr:hypothetical protein MKX01_031268 [Papaver californicum]
MEDFLSLVLMKTIVMSVLFTVSLFTTVFVLVTVLGLAMEWIMREKRPPNAGLMLNQLVYFKTLFDYQTFLSRKHRTHRFIMPSHSEIYTCDPINIEYILKTNFNNYGKGKYNYEIMKDLASYEFSSKVLRDFSSTVFRSNAAKLAAKVSEAAEFSKTIELQDALMKSTLDSMFKVGFGTELNSLSELDEFGVRFTKAFDDANEIVTGEAALKRNMKVINDFVFELIKHKRKQMKTGTKAEDSTANTLTWFFYMICKNPFIQEKIFKNTNIISAEEFAEKITEEAIEKMQYLHATLTETLRLFPAVPVDGKNANEEDALPVDGLKVRKGDGINYMHYAMARMTYIWGDDVINGVFQPENSFKFTAFQAGPRICLGKEFAHRQMKILAATLISFFKFKLGDEKKEAKYRTMLILHMDQGLPLFAFHRSK